MEEKVEKMEKCKCNKYTSCCSGAGAVYGFGLVGALVYYLQHASSFSVGLLGVAKAIVWPALFVYKVIQLLGL